MAWAPDYCEDAELKAFVNIDDELDDVQIALAITGASRAIDRAAGRQFGVVDSAEERVYTAEWDRITGLWHVNTDDLMTATGLAIEVPAGSVTSYRFEPGNAVSKGKPWTRIVVKADSAAKPDGCEDAVSITAQWGWTAVPATIKQATLLQASRILGRRESPFGVAGSPDLGNELRLLAKVDPDVAVLVASYRRMVRPG
jgi:hypothetical protein